jgi:nucleoside-diphosphate-sugar epimerase
MSRNVVITSIGSHTGGQIAKLLLSDGHFKRKVSSVTGLTLYPEIDSVKEAADLGAKIVEHKPGNLDEVVATLKETGADAILLLPPGHKDSYNITLELIEATKKANIPNVCFISSAGCDLAERDKQPLLRSVIDLEAKVLEAKGDASTETGHSPVIIR